jgi:hypothetical protein
VHHIAARYMRGDTVEEILADRPDLDPSLVHAALAYYFANKEQVEAELEAEDTLWTRVAERSPKGGLVTHEDRDKAEIIIRQVALEMIEEGRAQPNWSGWQFLSDSHV